MKTTEYIEFTINKLPKGYVFTYTDFTTEVNAKEAVIKSLNRLSVSGKINKLSKGRFYKPEKTPFGDLEPSQTQVVKDLLEKDGKLTGYITGLGIYNQLGFTTQVSYSIQIGRNEIRPSLKRGNYVVSFIKQKNTITKDNVYLLQLLDAIRFVNKIPDTTIAASCQRLQALLSKLDIKQQKTMVRLSRKYSPATRSLLGALLEHLNMNLLLEDLHKSLNPITVYKLSIAASILPTAPKWNIQ